MRIEALHFKKEDKTEVKIYVCAIEDRGSLQWSISDVTYREFKKRTWKSLGESVSHETQYRGMTNADKIKRMDIDELAEFLMKISCTNSPSCMMIDEDCKYFPDVPKDINGCKGCFKEWLESEVEL